MTHPGPKTGPSFLFWAKNGGRDKPGFGTRWVERQEKKKKRKDNEVEKETRSQVKLPNQTIKIINCPSVIINRI